MAAPNLSTSDRGEHEHDAPAPVEYEISLAHRARHLIDVTARFPVEAGALAADGSLHLRMAVWTPGSYLVREYERHLQDLRVTDERERPLAVRKIEKATFRVEPGGARFVVARYRVYAHDLSVRTNHADESHAYWNGASLYLYVDGLRDRRALVAIEKASDLRVATALEPEGDRFIADGYDTLVDSPVEVGVHERLDFAAAGRPVTVAIWGRPILPAGLHPDSASEWRARLQADFTAIIEAQAAFFGGDLPCPRYTFIVHLASGGYGGLEHKNSASLVAPPSAFLSEKRYADFLELVSHELFHLWNGKRIRPAALGPFDYQRENYTRSLWLVEGVTSYYDRLFLARAKRLSGSRYREKLGEDLSRLARIPGRARQSLEESSFDAWIKLYRPDESNVNTTVSYYLKGSVIALLLDLEIRRRTDGARSLDHVLARLWADFRATGRGYDDGAVQPLFEEATGVPLDDLFDRAVRGRGDVDLGPALAYVGLREKRGPNSGAPANGEEVKESGWLGANITPAAADRLRVTEVLEETPAQEAGLSPGDEIVAWDGYRVDDAGWKERLGAARPGTRVRLHLFRRDELRAVEVSLGRRPADKIEVVPIPEASEPARAAYAAWLGEPFPQ